MVCKVCERGKTVKSHTTRKRQEPTSEITVDNRDFPKPRKTPEQSSIKPHKKYGPQIIQRRRVAASQS